MQLADIFNAMDKGNDGISTQISELTVHMAADAKQSQILFSSAGNNFRSELKQIGSQLDSQLGALSNIMEKGTDGISAKISELREHMAADAKETQKLLALAVHEEKPLSESEQRDS